MSAAHNLKRGTSRVLSGFVTERVIFCYADGALLVTETCEYRGVRDQPKARHQLTPGTEVCWTWPEDADEFVEQLRARDCDDSRPISLSVGMSSSPCGAQLTERLGSMSIAASERL